MLKTSTKSSEYERPPAGTHRAVCCAVVDCGEHFESYGDQPEKLVRKIALGFELVDEAMSGTRGYNHVIVKTFSLSGHEKSALRKTMESIRGKPYTGSEEIDVSKLLGIPCLVNLTENEKGNVNLAGCSPLPKGMERPTARHQPFTWEFGLNGQQSDDLEVPTWFPKIYGETLAEYIGKSETWKMMRQAMAGTASAAVSSNSQDDNIPF